ncbi:MAG: hypothetical protein ACLTMP_03965 [Eggerthella lenta]
MLKEWSATADMTLYRCVSRHQTRAVLAALADRGLSWLPLKGALLVVIRRLMRSMADNDILYGFVKKTLPVGFGLQGLPKPTRALRRAVRVAVEVMEARSYRTIENSRQS